MAIRSHQCHSVACDVCKIKLLDYDTEGVVHYATEAEAAKDARRCGWLILPPTSTLRVICEADDEQHHAAIAEIMPPDPCREINGQLGFDGSEIE